MSQVQKNIIKEEFYGFSNDGEKIFSYLIISPLGVQIKLCNIGAALVSLIVPTSNKTLCDIVLGYDNLLYYIGDGPCFGKVPGRFANRIANGKFSLNGKTYQLPINNGPNHLHGGPNGFANRVWNSKIVDDSVVFTLFSKDGDSGYPGDLCAELVYSWRDSNLDSGLGSFTMKLKAKCSAPCPVNLTNHSYFNLNGHASGSVLDHRLKLYASKYLSTDSTLIPNASLEDVANTPMDFREFKRVGANMANSEFLAIKYGKGFDSCWVLDNWNGNPSLGDKSANGSLNLAAELIGNLSGIKLKVFTDSPGVQVYTGNWLYGCMKAKQGREYKDYDGIAIECQKFPDTPNKKNFPSCIVGAGEEYLNTIVFAVSI